jgi:non-ribosomal peptide synthetase component F
MTSRYGSNGRGRRPLATGSRFSAPRSDLIAGGAAAAVLLLVVALGVSPLLAVPLAVAIYAGTRLLQPSRERRRDKTKDETGRQERAYQTALANVVAIRALASRIAKPAVRDQVGRIADQTDRILAVMREDHNLAAAPLLNDRLLETSVALLTTYVRLSTRSVRSADALIEKTETHNLPLIEQATVAFYEQLHRGDVVDLAALGEVLEFSLEGIVATRPRRMS